MFVPLCVDAAPAAARLRAKAVADDVCDIALPMIAGVAAGGATGIEGAEPPPPIRLSPYVKVRDHVCIQNLSGKAPMSGDIQFAT